MSHMDAQGRRVGCSRAIRTNQLECRSDDAAGWTPSSSSGHRLIDAGANLSRVAGGRWWPKVHPPALPAGSRRLTTVCQERHECVLFSEACGKRPISGTNTLIQREFVK